MVPIETLSHYPIIYSCHWLREDVQLIIDKFFEEKLIVLMASTLSSSTFLLFFFLVFACICGQSQSDTTASDDLLMIQEWQKFLFSHRCTFYNNLVFIDFRWKPLKFIFELYFMALMIPLFSKFLVVLNYLMIFVGFIEVTRGQKIVQLLLKNDSKIKSSYRKVHFLTASSHFSLNFFSIYCFSLFLILFRF